MKKWISLVSVLFMMVCVSAPLHVIAAEAPISVYTQADLANIRYNLGGSYRLMNDITLTGKWKPLGYDENSAFTGIFDGQGFTVRGLSVQGAEKFAGLFGYSKGTIKNLILDDGLIDVNIDSYDKMHSGMIVGYNDGGTVEHCRTVGGQVFSLSYSFNDNHVGGVVGYSKDGTIKACHSSASVKAANTLTTPYNEFFTGGIVGAAYRTVVTLCSNRGTVHGGRTGGIVGWLSSGEASQCYNAGTVSTQMVEKGYSGGVVGHAENSVVRDSYSSGTVSAKTAVTAAVGGVIGYQQGGSLERAYSIGELSSEVLSPGGTRYMGGIVGNQGGMVRACYQPNYLPTGGGAAYPLPSLRAAATFREFDFSNVWTMDGRSTYPYPELRGVAMTADFAVPISTTVITTTSGGSSHGTTVFTYPSANVSTTEHTTTTQSVTTTTQSSSVVSKPTADWVILLATLAAVLLAAGIVCVIIVILKRK